jgi:hypothetical protein
MQENFELKWHFPESFRNTGMRKILLNKFKAVEDNHRT